jgi:uncharacterized protein YycO
LSHTDTATNPNLKGPFKITNNPLNPYNFGALNDPDNANGLRWGGASSACPDPTNPQKIWITCEWAALYNAWGISGMIKEIVESMA